MCLKYVQNLFWCRAFFLKKREKEKERPWGFLLRKYSSICLRFRRVTKRCFLMVLIFYVIITNWVKNLLHNSPTYIHVLHSNPLKKNVLLFGSVFISFFVTFVHLYVNRLEPILMLPPEALRDQLIGGSVYDRYLYQYHTPTHLNTGNYLVGLVIGFYYYQYRQTNGKSHHEKIFFLNALWNCSWIIILTLSLIGLYFYENDIELGVLSSLLGAFFKHFYGVILGVSLVGIFLRYGFFVPNIFNYGMHRILARLSFSVYMVHISIGCVFFLILCFNAILITSRSLFIMKNKFLIEINNSMLTAFTGIIYLLR